VSSNKKRVLIVPANTDLNRGDQSLTWESIEIAKDVFSPVEIYLYKAREQATKQSNINYQTEKLGYNFVSRILQHPRRHSHDQTIKYRPLSIIKWGFRSIYDTIITLMLLSKFEIITRLSLAFLNHKKRATYKLYQSLDAIIVKGGGFLHSYGGIKDAYVMYFQLFDVFLAYKFDIDVYILPNSIGPLKNRIAKRIVKSALSKASKIFVRESVSQEYLKNLRINSLLSPDLGFYLKPSEKDFTYYLEEKGINLKNQRNIAITLRPYRFDGEKNSNWLYENYLGQFTSLIHKLVKNDFNVSLIAHTLGPSAHENDILPLEKVYENFKDSDKVKFLFDNDLTSRDIEKIYYYYDLVIGTRFHSVIFALNVGTPAIAIAYGGYKAYGIMNDLELSQFVLPIEKTDASKILSLVYLVFKDEIEIKNKIKRYKSELSKKRIELLNQIKSNLIND
jgi:colanic acid/amylovoran biosynthesis protein